VPRLLRNYHIIEVTPTIQAAAYAANDQLGELMTLSGGVRFSEASSGSLLKNLTILDKASQSSTLDVYLFDASPTVASADNAALDISDAEMADKCIGVIKVASGDYTVLANSTLATVSVSDTLLKAIDGATAIFAIMASRGTPTYGSTSDLVLRFGIEQA